MHYVIGIDGGGTKTRGVLATTSGHVIKDLTTSSSNYQLIGQDKTQEVIDGLIKNLTQNLQAFTLDFVYLGLSGADLPEDFCILNKVVAHCLGQVPFLVENDTWCLLRSALQTSWGAVSLYGTGANAAAKTPDDKSYILRSLGFSAGGFGGGDDLAHHALHYAFRADELTYSPTLLQTTIPKLLNKTSMDQVLADIYPDFKIPYEALKALPPMIFDNASQGDQVCIDLLTQHGVTQGQMVTGILKQAGLENTAVPIVCGGSIFKGKTHHFLDAMMSTIQALAPEAYPVLPTLPPVAGAVLLALEKANHPVSSETYECLKRLE